MSYPIIYQIESDYLAKHSSCKAQEKIELDTMIANKSDKWIEQQYKQLFYERARAEVQQWIACFIDYYRHQSTGIPFSNIISQLKTIKSGNYGKVSAVVDDNVITFAIKKTKGKKKDELHDQEIIHEGFVGVRCLNMIRKFTPGFVFIYGVSTCRDNFDINPQVSTWCDRGKFSHNYLFMENIINAKQLENTIRRPDLNCKIISDCLIQLFSALKLANENFGFTHWDLHASNVLMESFEQPVAVPIYLRTGKKYLITNQIARIIDYGACSVQADGINFWVPNDGAVNDERSFPARDFCTIVYGIYTATKDNKNWVENYYQQKIQQLRERNKNLSNSVKDLNGRKAERRIENEAKIKKLLASLKQYRQDNLQVQRMMKHMYSKLGRDIDQDMKLTDRKLYEDVEKELGQKPEIFYNGYLVASDKYRRFNWNDFSDWLIEAMEMFEVSPIPWYDTNHKNWLIEQGVTFSAE